MALAIADFHQLPGSSGALCDFRSERTRDPLIPVFPEVFHVKLADRLARCTFSLVRQFIFERTHFFQQSVGAFPSSAATRLMANPTCTIT
jgi:hypothetical protein